MIVGVIAAAPFVWLWLANVLWRYYGISVVQWHEYQIIWVASLGPYLAMVTIGLANAARGGRDPCITALHMFGILLICGVFLFVGGWIFVLPALALAGVAIAVKHPRGISANDVAYLFAAVALFGMFFVLIAWFLLLPALVLGGWTARRIYRRRMRERSFVMGGYD